MAVDKVSKGTTIISIPTKEGIIIAADTQGTDTRSFETYVCKSKTTNNLVNLKGVEIYVSGAGAAFGDIICGGSFYSYFEKKCLEYCIDLNVFSANEIIGFICMLGVDYLKKIHPVEADWMNHSSFIITIKTQKTLFSVKSDLPFFCEFRTVLIDDLTWEGDTKNLVGVGSGSRYVLGAVLYKLKKEGDFKTNKEAKEWVINYLKPIIELDLASSVKRGLSVFDIYKSPSTNTKYQRYQI